MKNKHISIRIPLDLYNRYVKETINRSNKENKIINFSEIIREVLNNGLKDG